MQHGTNRRNISINSCNIKWSQVKHLNSLHATSKTHTLNPTMGTAAEDDVASTMARDEGPRDGGRRLLSSSRELRQASSRPHGSSSLLPGREGHQHVPLAACGLLVGGARRGGWGRRDAVELSPRPARHQGVGGPRAGGGLAAEEPSTELAHGLRAATFWPPRAGLGLHAGRGRKQHGRRSHRGEDGRLMR
jgi:hypothetical protein